MARRSDVPSEAQFQATVVELATLTGWLAWHDHDSRRNAPGFPDLVLVKPPRLLMIEVKSARGRLRAEQRVWLATLAQCQGVEVAVWRPADWEIIEAALVQGQRLPPYTER